jgi:hypothetical protein
MYVARDFNFHPDVPVYILNCMLLLTIAVEDVTADVSPISVVDVSVYVVVPPFHTVITSPALALEPLDTVYLKNADVYDPVACVNRLFAPTIDDVTVYVVFNVFPIVNVVAYDAVAAVVADVANDVLTAV